MVESNYTIEKYGKTTVGYHMMEERCSRPNREEK